MINVFGGVPRKLQCSTLLNPEAACFNLTEFSIGRRLRVPTFIEVAQLPDSFDFGLERGPSKGEQYRASFNTLRSFSVDRICLAFVQRYRDCQFFGFLVYLFPK
jgi:hypothetical protein